MNWNVLFFLNSILLGVGLAMDAFSVSIANALNEPQMKRSRMYLIAGTFAVFQALMPIAGWICVHTIVQFFQTFEKLIPWIALILLCYIGIRMILECVRDTKAGQKEHHTKALGFSALMIQGIATSIDALSVGFTISDYGWVMALVCSLIIAAVTFVICMVGLKIGKLGTRLFIKVNKAGILGGVILILIGIEIFIKGIL